MEPMKVLIVNASPKGEYSLTLQHARYLAVHEPGIEWSVSHVGEKLTDIEFDRAWLDGNIAAVEACDAIIWATPVYTMLVPWQLIRFFSLVREAGKEGIFAGKYATIVMSCFHYYDNLAEEWLRGACEDLGMAFVEGLSVDNKDMLRPEFRASMRFFLSEFHRACATRAPVARRSRPLVNAQSPKFVPSRAVATPTAAAAAGCAAQPALKNTDLRTVLLTDERGKNGNLSPMIEVFLDSYPNAVDVVDINDFPAVTSSQVPCASCRTSVSSWRAKTGSAARIPCASSATRKPIRPALKP